MKKILIVDDDPGVLRLVESVLKKNGFQVATASDGMEAIVMVQRERPALVVLDIMMPNLDGHAFIQEITDDEELRHTPILVLTGHDDVRERLKNEGVEHCLSKPIDTIVFLDTVSHILRGSGPPIRYQ